MSFDGVTTLDDVTDGITKIDGVTDGVTDGGSGGGRNSCFVAEIEMAMVKKWLCFFLSPVNTIFKAIRAALRKPIL